MKRMGVLFVVVVLLHVRTVITVFVSAVLYSTISSVPVIGEPRQKRVKLEICGAHS